MVGIRFSFSVFCMIICKFSVELNYRSILEETFRNHMHKPAISLTLSTSPSNLRQLSTTQQQWLNYRYYSSINCNNDDYLTYYGSTLFGGCTQEGGESFSESASISNGNVVFTLSIYSNTQCSGTPLRAETNTQPSCTNNNGSETTIKIYSVTNNLPPLPGGFLTR